jgi:hypothetical protein
VDPDGASSSGGSAEPERVEFADEDPARRAAADVERLMSEATGLRRIVDLAGEVREGGRPDLMSGSGRPIDHARAAPPAEPGSSA